MEATKQTKMTKEDLHLSWKDKLNIIHSEKALMLSVSRFNGVVENAFEEKAPHKICAYIYELANEFNHFYHETKILSEQDEARKASYLALLDLVREVLETCIDLLGFSAPERM